MTATMRQTLTDTQDQAIAHYSRLNSNRDNLVEQQRQDSSVQPPYFWHHIRPECRKQAIIDTWQGAAVGSEARRLFDRGATSGEHAPNWVTLWLLYSVFRSRDVRNNRNRRGDGASNANGKRPPQIHEPSANSTPCSGGHGSDSRIYDPARDEHRKR